MKAATPAQQVRKQPDPVSQSKPSVAYVWNNKNSTSAKNKEAAAQQSQKRPWLETSSSNDDLTQKQLARREPEKPKEENKTGLFKGSSTNPFAKLTTEPAAPKKERIANPKKKEL